MFRFDSKQGYYIYPDENDGNDGNMKLELLSGAKLPETNLPVESISDRTDKVIVTKLGLRVPKNSNNFRDFCENIKKSEDSMAI
jgi:hypothetical protein